MQESKKLDLTGVRQAIQEAQEILDKRLQEGREQTMVYIREKTASGNAKDITREDCSILTVNDMRAMVNQGIFKKGDGKDFMIEEHFDLDESESVLWASAYDLRSRGTWVYYSSLVRIDGDLYYFDDVERAD